MTRRTTSSSNHKLFVSLIFVLSLIYGATAAGWSGVFNLPETIWAWWVVEGLVIYCLSSAALGWFVGKFASD